MRIGIDFDNTIADYENVFHAAARELGLGSSDLPMGKNAIRDLFNGSGRKDDFTALQGYVYGARMQLASPYPGAREFITAAKAGGHHLFIVSHKTRHPIVGPAYDMHSAAQSFLIDKNIVGSSGIASGDVFFEPTKEHKIARLAMLNVDVLIDDLPEILLTPGWPVDLRRILFRPDGDAIDHPSVEMCRSWREISNLLLGCAS